MANDYELTPTQAKAFASLERAMRKCKAAGVYLWDDYGTISAVNGRKLNAVTTNPKDTERLDDAMVTRMPGSASSKCWRGSNADDALFVER